MTQDFRLKIFSLFIAMFFWYLVTTDVRIATVSVPIEVENPPSDRVIISDFTQQALVKVSGPSFLVSEILSSPPVFNVEVPPEVGERYVVNLRGDELSLPSAVQVLAIEPSELTISLDKKVTKSVPVQVPRIGRLETDLSIESSSVVPSKVTITGPAQEVEKIEEVETFPIDLRQVSSSIQRELELRKPGVKTTVDTQRVNWTLQVVPVEASRTFANLAVETRSLRGEAYRLRPEEVNVMVRGRQSAVQGLEPLRVVPFVRIRTGMKPGERVPVEIDLPGDLELVSVSPSQVAVARDNGAK